MGRPHASRLFGVAEVARRRGGTEYGSPGTGPSACLPGGVVRAAVTRIRGSSAHWRVYFGAAVPSIPLPVPVCRRAWTAGTRCVLGWRFFAPEVNPPPSGRAGGADGRVDGRRPGGRPGGQAAGSAAGWKRGRGNDPARQLGSMQPDLPACGRPARGADDVRVLTRTAQSRTRTGVRSTTIDR